MVMAMTDVDTPFPVRGEVTPKRNGFAANLQCASEWLTETENGDLLQRAVDRAAREYGTGNTVRVEWTDDGHGIAQQFQLLGPADDGEDAPEEQRSGAWIGVAAGMSVRAPGEDADHPVLELHGDEGMAALEVPPEFTEALTHAAAELDMAREDAGEDPEVRTDGGGSENWTERYPTDTHRGPQQYPVPGGWALGIVEADGIGWKYYADASAPDTEEPDAFADLMVEFPAGADPLTDRPNHELRIGGEVVLTLKDASAVEDESEWWTAIAEALARYDRGEYPEGVLSDMGLEHLSADADGGEPDDSDRSLDEFATDGGYSEVCDDCGRHIAVAGHEPDCPRVEDTGE